MLGFDNSVFHLHFLGLYIESRHSLDGFFLKKQIMKENKNEGVESLLKRFKRLKKEGKNPVTKYSPDLTMSNSQDTVVSTPPVSPLHSFEVKNKTEPIEEENNTKPFNGVSSVITSLEEIKIQPITHKKIK